MSHFDIAYAGDLVTLRYWAERISEEIAIHSVAGYTTAIVPLPRAAPTEAIGESIARCARERRARIIEPGATTPDATLAILPVPVASTSEPVLVAPLLRADRTLLVFDGPAPEASPSDPLDSASWAAEITRGEVQWAPTSEAIRAALEPPLHATPSDTTWEPVFHPSYWMLPSPDRLTGELPVIGRCALPLPGWWPDSLRTLLRFYPISRHAEVRLMGPPEDLLAALEGRPRHWKVFPHTFVSTRKLVRGLDAFLECMPLERLPSVRTHILAAMAAGVATVVPRAEGSEFEEVCLSYDEPEEALTHALALCRVSESYATQSERSRQFVFDRHGPAVHVGRLQRMIGAPKSRSTHSSPPLALTGQSRRASVLLVTSNGVGVGHVTRLLAIAKRLPGDVRAVFATMSSACSIIRREGFHAEHIPFHQYAQCSVPDWNRWLYAELLRLTRFFGVRVMVFDGHVPYNGLCDVLSTDTELRGIWCRRAMWTRPVWDEVIERTKYFDRVIEPGELAAEYDVGATVAHRHKVQVVEPVTLMNPGDLLAPELARAALGLDTDRLNVLLQLGSGNHINIAPAVEQILETLERLGGFEVLLAEWPNSDHSLDQWSGLKRLRIYPHSRYYYGFDFVISACGYNSFHELTQNAIPSIFVPLEVSFLDNQLARAKFAQDNSLGLCLRLSEFNRLEDAVTRIVDPEVRQRIHESCTARRSPNGAGSAARAISALLG